MIVNFSEGTPCQIHLRSQNQREAFELGQLSEIAPVSCVTLRTDYTQLTFDVVVVDPADSEVDL